MADKNKLTDPCELKPFDNIALCISGGGFRASGFGLGVLSYLNEVKRLENVSYLSTTSGGSLLAALYMKSLCKGEKFEVFYNEALKFMNGEVLLTKALKKLESKSEWTHTEKNRNLINSFAKVYDEYLGGQTFGDYWTHKDSIHIKQNCYNSTEFNTGITFRFISNPFLGKDENGRSVFSNIGNRYIKLQEDAAKNLKVADIIAASSCFPAGFEPLLFPNDFSVDDNEVIFYNKNLAISNPYNEIVQPPFALMDGGITDNQGIESMMNADRSRQRAIEVEQFSTVIVADVSNKFMEPWHPPVQSSGGGSINNIIKAIKWMPLMFIVALVLICFRFTYGLGLLLLIPTLIGAIISFFWNSTIKKIKAIFDTGNNISWDKIMSRYLHYFASLPFGNLMFLIKTRLTSVGILAYDIFLKQVRRMRYDELYEDEDWKNRRISSMIYELNEKNTLNFKSELVNKIERLKLKEDRSENEKLAKDHVEKIWSQLVPSSKLKNIAQYASTTGTTLWFDKEEVYNQRLQKIIATGQFTTCYNLLEYLYLLEYQCPNGLDKDLKDLKEKLMEDWAEFNKNPMHLVEK
jgi:predicted acylesterase/phospholipase RssA